MCQSVYVDNLRESFLSFSHVGPGTQNGPQAWWQALLSAEPSCGLSVLLFTARHVFHIGIVLSFLKDFYRI